MAYYRFISNNLGIYEAVENDCPQTDARRINKPDGSWLPRVGTKYPGAISYWTEFGLTKYCESGLIKWHNSVVNSPVEILIAKTPSSILYSDEYQIICKPSDIKVLKRKVIDKPEDLEQLLDTLLSSTIRISQADRDRAVEVAKVFKASRTHGLPYLPELHTQEEDIHFFTNVVFPESKVFVALDSAENKVVGFIAFKSDFIDHLYVLPGYQSQKIGTKLINVAQSCSKNLQLWTFQRNTRAIEFYKRHGFLKIQETDGSGNEEKEPDILMEWRRE